jgi:hypothetical protein
MRCCIPMAVLLAFGVSRGGAADDPVKPLDGDAIAALWKERQEKVKTAKFEFSRTYFSPKGGLNKRSPSIIIEWEKSPDFVDGPIPSKDLRMTSESRLLLDGAKVRHDYSSEQCNFKKRDYYHKKEWNAFDGTHFRVITGIPAGEEGSVSKASYYPEANIGGISVLFTSVRGATNGVSFRPQRLTSTGRQAAIDGVECLEYEAYKTPTQSITAWLAPSQGWHVLRVIDNVPTSGVMNKTEVRYKADPTVGWLPATWEYTHIVKGEVLLQTSFKLTSYKLNEPIDAGEFVLTFPKGMKVLDEDAPGGGGVGTVQEDGRVEPEDGRPAYYLPGTEPAARKWVRAGLIVATAATAGLLAWRVVRRYRRSRILAVSPEPRSSPEGVQP